MDFKGIPNDHWLKKNEGTVEWDMEVLGLKGILFGMEEWREIEMVRECWVTREGINHF